MQFVLAHAGGTARGRDSPLACEIMHSAENQRMEESGNAQKIITVRAVACCHWPTISLTFFVRTRGFLFRLIRCRADKLSFI